MGSDVLWVAFNEIHVSMAGLMSCVKRACSAGHPLVSQNWCCWLVGMVRWSYVHSWMVNFVSNDVQPIRYENLQPSNQDSDCSLFTTKQPSYSAITCIETWQKRSSWITSSRYSQVLYITYIAKGLEVRLHQCLHKVWITMLYVLLEFKMSGSHS